MPLFALLTAWFLIASLLVSLLAAGGWASNLALLWVVPLFAFLTATRCRFLSSLCLLITALFQLPAYLIFAAFLRFFFCGSLFPI